jgi:hypothetical protein
MITMHRNVILSILHVYLLLSLSSDPRSTYYLVPLPSLRKIRLVPSPAPATWLLGLITDRTSDINFKGASVGTDIGKAAVDAGSVGVVSATFARTLIILFFPHADIFPITLGVALATSDLALDFSVWAVVRTAAEDP